MKRVNLEWKVLDEDRVALIFDKPAWLAFQSVADGRGLDTSDMISETIVRLLGPIIATPAKN
jgi:hypothetical protein